MIDLIGWGGAPASGKTRLMRALLERRGLTRPRPFEFSLVKGQAYPEQKVLVWGLYPPGETFGGTDRLSMAVMPIAQMALAQLASHPAWEGWRLLLEGDRLFSEKFLTSALNLLGKRAHFFILTASAGARSQRAGQRGSSQNAQWVRGRVTKVERLVRLFRLESFAHETPADTERLVGYIGRLLGDNQEASHATVAVEA